MNIVENNPPYFTIVMPAYGVEKYIDRAIVSIKEQTFEDWELIVVDDCSKDKSGQIAEQYAKEDACIRVIHHKVNQGLSAARNTGTEAALGEYIWYMDPDDWADKTLLEQIYVSLQRNPAQVVLFGHIEEYYDKQGRLQYSHAICPEEHCFETAEEFHPYIIKLEQETLYGYAWNKFYHLPYIRELKLIYEDVKLIEDITFNVKYFMNINSLNTLSISPYHYGKRMEGNLTNKFVPDYFKLHKDRIEMLFEQFIYWHICTEEIRGTLGSLYSRYILSALERNCDRRAGMDLIGRYRWCKFVFEQRMFNELIPVASAKESMTLCVALMCFRRKQTILCLLMGRGIYVVKKCLPVVYSKVKSGR